MSLSIRCPECGTAYKAPESAIGRTASCKVCGARIPITAPQPIDPAAILLAGEDAKEPSAPPKPPESAAETEASEAPASALKSPRKGSKRVDVASLPPLGGDEPPLWRRHLHWLLVLALIPLVASLLVGAKEADIPERIDEALDQATPEQRARILSKIKETGALDLDDVLSVLPGNRLPGAFLSRSSYAHFLMALLAAAAYMAFFMFLAADGSARPTHVLLVGLFTATIGVGFLLLVQLLASLTGGRIIVGANVVALIFLVLKLIAFSYSAAMDPENGFLLSFLGFTFGVGLCEEFVKVIPVYWHRSTESGRTWRGMLVWGLASGAGFGIAEGIMYSGEYYNGFSGPGIYVVRFISCVALHAIWTGSAAIFLFIRRDLFDGLANWYDWIFPTILVIGVPAVLHGLYDTCLKREMNGVALLAAFASFGYLAFLFSRLQTGDDEVARKVLLREYQRRKAAMGRA